MIIGRFILLLSVLTVFVFADSESDVVFAKAKKLYAEKQYDSTVAVAKKYLKRNGRDPETEHIVPLLMEALVRIDDDKYFQKIFLIYKKKFPTSIYLPRMIYLNGVVTAKKQDYKNAVLTFSEAYKAGLSSILDSLTLLNVTKICNEAMTAQELSSIQMCDIEQEIAEIVGYFEIKKLHIAGNLVKAGNYALRYRNKYPDSPYAPKLKQFISKTKSERKKRIQIGLMAPISGENEDIGKFVVQGVRLAFDIYNRTHEQKVELVICDTKGSVVETARKVFELVDVHGVSIIIGPVLSANATVAAAALVKNPNVVMITPTATSDGIAALGRNIFQMNVTLSILGQKIAQYAIKNLQIREFVIIQPISEYGDILSASFTAEVKRLGGEIIATEHFDEGTNDFRLQFTRIRKTLAERLWAQASLDGDPSSNLMDAQKYKRDQFVAESTIVVGGLFIPVESEDAVKIASQVYFHRLRTQMLGSNGWHTPTTILDGKKYVNNTVVSTNFETNAINEKWTAFNALFVNRFRTIPDRVAAPLGYDVANLIIETIKNASDTQSIISHLLTLSNFNGVSGKISFDGRDGVNTEAAILKIRGKEFVRLQ